MFYCNDCAKKNGYPETIFKSGGKCECCGSKAVCNEMPSSKLPLPKKQGLTETQLEGIAYIKSMDKGVCCLQKGIGKTNDKNIKL
jgi:hypothetical protein